MVVLKVGDWCVYQSDKAVHKEDRLVRITDMKEWAVNARVYWTDCDAFGYADKEYLTPLPEELYPILSDSIRTEDV